MNAFLRAIAKRDGAPPYSPDALTHGKRIGRRLTRMLLTVEVSGLEHVPLEGPVLVAGNHTGLLDGPLVMVWAPRAVRTLTKVQIYRGVVGRYLHHIGQIPLDRDQPDRAALQTCVRELARGGAVCIFPEGTRGAGALDEVKDGVGYLAAHSAAPIVPVACLGTQAALPKGKKLPRRKAPIKLVFGPAFTLEPPDEPGSRAAVHDLAEAIRLRLLEHLERAAASLKEPA